MTTGGERELARAIASEDSLRDMETYLHDFNLTLNSLGDLTLDIGSGSVQRFARQVDKYTQGRKKVISVNPNWIVEGSAHERNRNEDYWADPNLPEGKNGAAALAQQLPFASSSIDMVLAHFSVPLHLQGVWLNENPERRELLQVLSEIVRVLKTDKTAHLYPITILDKNTWNVYIEVFEKINEKAEGKFFVHFELLKAPLWYKKKVYRLVITKTGKEIPTSSRGLLGKVRDLVTGEKRW